MRSLALDGCCGSPLLALPTSIERLCLSGLTVEISHAVPDDRDVIHLAGFPALTELEIDSFESLSMALRDALARRRANFTHISLSRGAEVFFADYLLGPSVPTPTVGDDGSRDIQCQLRCSALISLRMRECDVGDSILERVAAYCPRLESLDVSSNPKLTGAGVVAVVQKPGVTLQQLNLTNCTGVSPDAVAWARAKGVKVTYRFPDNGSGKKLRGV